MKLDVREKPELSGSRADEISLSREALLDLMTAVLARGRAFRFKARGWSMTPFIRDGDVITIVPIVGDRCRLGDVVAFTHPETGRLVVHRIIDRMDADYLIQGDSSLGETDGIIRHDQLLGQVSGVERNGRRVWLGIGAERKVIAWLSRRMVLARFRLGLVCLREKIRKLLSK